MNIPTGFGDSLELFFTSVALDSVLCSSFSWAIPGKKRLDSAAAIIKIDIRPETLECMIIGSFKVNEPSRILLRPWMKFLCLCHISPPPFLRMFVIMSDSSLEGLNGKKNRFEMKRVGFVANKVNNYLMSHCCPVFSLYRWPFSGQVIPYPFLYVKV